MKSDQEVLIDGYLSNTLTALQKQEFDKLMSEDRQFAEEVAFYEKMKLAIRLEEREKLKARFNILEQPSNNRKTWWYAAAAMLVLGIMGWWGLTQFSLNPENLYYSYFEPYPNIVEPIVRSDAEQSGLSAQAFEWYEKGEYEKASEAFATLHEEHQAAADLFYQAISLMALDRSAEAIPMLKQQKEEDSFYEAAQWYLALAYLKEGQESQARSCLERVRDADGFLSSQAIDLLNELDNTK
ncbi:tetratricopeptide repeat protein [Algoriphagus vanfongensis]|uniref:tetratricopeptide repeat protein n=1 Tax=Algoriphagus vanfongensis TaxID=426371 RepID=UPI000400ABDF|nr:tetratricopeptide repeat protein [Algoriphagus vanfongensis]